MVTEPVPKLAGLVSSRQHGNAQRPTQEAVSRFSMVAWALQCSSEQGAKDRVTVGDV
jgi:hypothetical protein